MTSCLEQAPTNALVVQGQDLSLNVRLVNPSGDPFDITNATEIVGIFPTTVDPLYVEKKMSLSQVSIESGAGGRMLILLTPQDTAILTPGAQISFEVRITISGKITIVQFPLALNVVASQFPTAP